MLPAMSLKSLIRPLVPPALLAWRQARWRAAHSARLLWDRGPELEMRFLPVLCDRARGAVDVGGHEGGYAWHMRRMACRLDVFEAAPDLAANLARAFRLHRNTRVHAVALSAAPGEATLRRPLRGAEVLTGLATIESDNQLEGFAARAVTVPVRRLDDFGLRDVGFMKIDVEGHELAVLQGAPRLLAESRPHLQIEAQERHRPDAVRSLAAFLAGFGYGGFFLHAGELHDIATYDPMLHQHPDSLDALGKLVPGHVHIANFIFSTDCDGLKARLAPIAASLRNGLS
jgi:FkbM family methyltransferase